MKSKHVLQLVLLVSILAPLCGCMAAYVGGLAADVFASGENTKINAAVSPGVTKEQLGEIKRVAIIFSEDSPIAEAYTSGGLTDILVDNITIEIMKLGYECTETAQLKKVLAEEGIQITGPLDLENAIKAGKKMGLHAIITGNVKSNSSFKHSSSFVTGKMTSSIVIQSATLKVLGVENGDSLMMIAINYKNGQKPDSAAKSMVKILKTTLDDPLGEAKKKQS